MRRKLVSKEAVVAGSLFATINRAKGRSRRPRGVGVEEAAGAGGADDVVGSDRVLRRGWFVPVEWKMVASGVRPLAVVPT